MHVGLNRCGDIFHRVVAGHHWAVMTCHHMVINRHQLCRNPPPGGGTELSHKKDDNVHHHRRLSQIVVNIVTAITQFF